MMKREIILFLLFISMTAGSVANTGFPSVLSEERQDNTSLSIGSHSGFGMFGSSLPHTLPGTTTFGEPLIQRGLGTGGGEDGFEGGGSTNPPSSYNDIDINNNFIVFTVLLSIYGMVRYIRRRKNVLGKLHPNE